MIVPPVDEQFVSDAVNTLDPPVKAEEIAELWVDQNATGPCSEAEFKRAVDKITPQVAWYLA
jgi:hypothetical protein